MTSIAEFIQRLVSYGVDPIDAGALTVEIFSAGATSVTRRSPGAERTRRWRQKKQAEGQLASHVTRDVADDAAVTERLKTSQADTTGRAPLPNNLKISEGRIGSERSRGTRISPDWRPSAEDIAAARNLEMSAEAVDREALKFLDHWLASSGSQAVKLDWSAVWRNWIRRSLEYSARAYTAKPDNSPVKVTFWAKPESEELRAWDEVKIAETGRPNPRDKNGGWTFSSRWPPGYRSDADNRHKP